MNAAPISVDSAPHYVWGAVCDGWHLVQSAALSIIEERMPAGASEHRHSHQYARQFFYVLEGELTMEVAGEEHRLLRGQGLEIAPGLPHQALNRSVADVRFLVVSQPPSHGDRMDA